MKKNTVPTDALPPQRSVGQGREGEHILQSGLRWSFHRGGTGEGFEFGRRRRRDRPRSVVRSSSRFLISDSSGRRPASSLRSSMRAELQMRMRRGRR